MSPDAQAAADGMKETSGRRHMTECGAHTYDLGRPLKVNEWVGPSQSQACARLLVQRKQLGV